MRRALFRMHILVRAHLNIRLTKTIGFVPFGALVSQACKATMQNELGTNVGCLYPKSRCVLDLPWLSMWRLQRGTSTKCSRICCLFGVQQQLGQTIPAFRASSLSLLTMPLIAASTCGTTVVDGHPVLSNHSHSNHDSNDNPITKVWRSMKRCMPIA